MKTIAVIDRHGNVRRVDDPDYVLRDGERVVSVSMMFMDALRNGPVKLDDNIDEQQRSYEEYKRAVSDAWRHDGAAQRIKSTGDTIEDAQRDYETFITNAWRNPQ